MGIEILVIVI